MSESTERRGVRRRNSRILIQDSGRSNILTPIIGYAQEPLLSLGDACAPLIHTVHNILMYVVVALQGTPNDPPHGLTRDESASIRLYTMEWTGGHKSLYSILNKTLQTADREHLRPWFKYLKLFLTALVKVPCASQQTVWRGVRKDISDDFPRGAPVTWWAFSSCTTTLSVLENNLYLGTTGERTLFSIEVFNGRNIRAHSYFNNEDEILLLPGTYMEVKSQFNPAPDLYIIHLKQKMPNEMLLEPPFAGACLYPTIERRWYRKKRFFISICLLTIICIVAVILDSVLGSRSTIKPTGTTNTTDVQARAAEFLSQVGLTISASSKNDGWVTLCSVQARIANSGINELRDTQTCTHIVNGEIKETRVKVNVQWRCEYRTDLYSSGTMATYQNKVASQYDAGIKLAMDAGEKATIDYMQTMKNQHLQNLQAAGYKDAAKLTATATSAPWFGDGANCDLTLEGLINELY